MIQSADYFLANGFPVMMMPNGSEGSMKPLSQSSSFQFRPPADESRRLLVLLEISSAYGHFSIKSGGLRGSSLIKGSGRPTTGSENIMGENLASKSSVTTSQIYHVYLVLIRLGSTGRVYATRVYLLPPIGLLGAGRRLKQD